MSAPAKVEPVSISVAPNREADRVMYRFGDQVYGLSVEDVAMLVNQSLDAVEVLRPNAAPGMVQ